MIVRIGNKEKKEWLDFYYLTKRKRFADSSPEEKHEFVLAMDILYRNLGKIAAPHIDIDVFVCPVDGKKFKGVIDTFSEYSDPETKDLRETKFMSNEPIEIQCPDGHTLTYVQETGELKSRERISSIDDVLDKAREVKKSDLPKEVK